PGPATASPIPPTPPIGWQQSSGAVPPGTVFTDIVAIHGLFVAVGHGPDPTAHVWTSRDGLSWEQMSFPATGWEGPSRIDISDSGFPAVGGQATSTGYHLSIWTSSDARTWTAEPDVSQLTLPHTAGGQLSIGWAPAGFLVLGDGCVIEGADLGGC